MPTFNYYLKEDAYQNCHVADIESNFKELNVAITNSTNADNYLRSGEFDKITTDTGENIFQVLFSRLSDIQFMRMVMPFILQKIKVTDYIDSIDSFCDRYKEYRDVYNAFWGIRFNANKKEYELTNSEELKAFKYLSVRKNINIHNFKEYSEQLFTSLVMCSDVYKEIKEIQEGKMFAQVIDQLEKLNDYGRQWIEGNFELADLNSSTSISASGESHTVNTNKDMIRQRTFQLPNGDYKYFEHHIKTGEYRIYFLADNDKHIFYIGYIGDIGKHFKSANN